VLCEHHSAGGELIEVWCANFLLAETADFTKAQIVGEDIDDIQRRLWLLLRLLFGQRSSALSGWGGEELGGDRQQGSQKEDREMAM
jgi:hypothetical protein